MPFGGYEVIREHWSAYQAYISGRKLYELYTTYNDDLFSANPRRFLGIGKKTNIINLGIKESAKMMRIISGHIIMGLQHWFMNMIALFQEN